MYINKFPKISTIDLKNILNPYIGIFKTDYDLCCELYHILYNNIFLYFVDNKYYCINLSKNDILNFLYYIRNDKYENYDILDVVYSDRFKEIMKNIKFINMPKFKNKNEFKLWYNNLNRPNKIENILKIIN